MWMLLMTQRCCLSLTSFVAGILYLERLRTQGLIQLYESTWRSLWVTMMIVSEKWWEDNYVHPGHITKMFNSSHTQKEFLENQLELFKALNYHLNLDIEEFNRW